MSDAVLAGRYTLLRKLATGGMAEVFLARQGGAEGFEKLVVVKRILPSFSENPDFVRMFLDEARTAADLRHPNVVSVTDVGSDQGTWFIAMEYLHGVDQAHLAQRCKEKGEWVPVAHAVQMISDAALGLHYAHQKKTLAGEPLHLVHRDISPQNLFVTSDGQTKVLDFGIARAARRNTRTDAGVVKGKYGYLSPEQLEGAELDARSDLFALGICLWELTTLRRLFHAPSDAEVLRRVMECKVPRPGSLLPDYPRELEDIVMKALAKLPKDRFESCAAFQIALEDFLDAKRLPHSASRVSQFLKPLFPEWAQPEAFTAQAPAPAPVEVTRADGQKKPKAKTGETRPVRRRPQLKEAQGFLDAVEQFLGTSAEKRRSNIVPPRGAYVGRANELNALHALVQKSKLVTVVGFGGMGKTRLALRYAEVHGESWLGQGGTWFVDLADARTEDDVVKAVARSLELSPSASRDAADSVTQTGRTLSSLGPALVVLDNFEQLVPLAKQTVGQWLKAAPKIQFLVTSREGLHLEGEELLPLAPLVEQSAVQLFLARMEAVGLVPPSSAPELSVIAEIVHRLDGHPLAIELAAARTPTLSLQDVLVRLQERFLLLGDAGPGRHATLWNAIDWSYQLLDESERTAFEQLSVFRGGFTLESAEAVLRLPPGSPPAQDVVEALHQKSLLKAFVAPEARDVLRLTMFESLHLFAAQQLEAHAQVEETRLRHAAHFLEQGEVWAEEILGHRAAECLASLAADRENLLEIYERSLSAMPRTTESATRVLRALHSLDALLSRRGPFHSHLALLESGLEVAATSKVNPAEIARALAAKATVLRRRGQLTQANTAIVQALDALKNADDVPLEGRVTLEFGIIQHVLGALSDADEAFEKALRLSREVKDEATELKALTSLAILHLARRELPDALGRCDEALPLARTRGDGVNEARVLCTVGTLYLEEGRLELARAFYDEARDRAVDAGESRLEGFLLGKMAGALLEAKDLAQARVELNRALALTADVGDLRHEGLFHGYLASLEALEHHPDAARMHLSAAHSRLSVVKDPLLLTAHALRVMHVELEARSVSAAEARALLDEVREPKGNRPARVFQSDEVRLAARVLERSLGAR